MSDYYSYRLASYIYFHAALKELIQARDLMFWPYQLSQQGIYYEEISTITFADRVRSALKLGRVEISEDILERHEWLDALSNDVEIIIRFSGSMLYLDYSGNEYISTNTKLGKLHSGFDSIATVGEAKIIIQEFIDHRKQEILNEKKGLYTHKKIAQMMQDESQRNLTECLRSIEDAYIDNKLVFYDHTGKNVRNDCAKDHQAVWELLLKLVTRIDDVNKWLADSGDLLQLPLDEEALPKHSLITSKALFINPPKNHTLIFSEAKEAVNLYIKKYHVLPDRDQLWNFIADKDAFTNLSRDRESFRKNFSRWTSKKEN